jgi:hypothetical protein
VRDLTDSYSVKDTSPAGPDQTAPTRQLHDPPTPARSGARPAADIAMEPYNQFVRAARRFQEQPASVRARHREQLNDLAVKLSTVLPIVEESRRADRTTTRTRSATSGSTS